MRKVLVLITTLAFVSTCSIASAKNQGISKWFGKGKNTDVNSVSQDSKATAEKAKHEAKEKAIKAKNDIDEKSQAAKNEAKGKADKASVGAKKKTNDGKKHFLGFAWGKNHQQQLKALDDKAARQQANSQGKIADLEKDLAAAKAANDSEKAGKIEKKIESARQSAADDEQKIQQQRDKIKSEMDQQ